MEYICLGAFFFIVCLFLHMKLDTDNKDENNSERRRRGMTREEAIEILKELWKYEKVDYTDNEVREALEMAIAALKAEPCEEFVKWVATEIFDDMWKYNKDAFAEIACRKLAKLGIVIRMGDEWVLVNEEGESEKE